MSYNYCKDHRSGITYVYEMEKSTDGSSGKPKTSRKLIGRLDDDGNIVPTSGRRGRLPKKTAAEESGTAGSGAETEALKDEIRELKKTVAALRSNQKEVIKGLEGLLALAKKQAQK